MGTLKWIKISNLKSLIIAFLLLKYIYSKNLIGTPIMFLITQNGLKMMKIWG
jgi:hypothetical protein